MHAHVFVCVWVCEFPVQESPRVFLYLIHRYSNSLRGVILWALVHCWSVTLRCAHWTMWLHFQEIACTPIRSDIRIQKCSVQSHKVGLLLGLILIQSIVKKKRKKKKQIFVNGIFPQYTDVATTYIIKQKQYQKLLIHWTLTISVHWTNVLNLILREAY